MNENNKDLINSIRTNVEKYWQLNNKIEFNASNPRVNLHEPTFGPDEVMSMVEVMLSTQVTMGKKVLGFEDDLSNYFNISEAVTNNSGSSANLLAISALVNKMTPNNLNPGDEVIVPALSWSTTVWPLIQNGLVPVFVDIDPNTLNISPMEIEKAISNKTKAVMIVPVYGNPCNMDSIVEICQKRELQLIEDNCESLGAYYDDKPLGSFGRVSSYSFYFSHHISTLEGGVTLTNDFELAEVMRIIRAHGWVREAKDKEKHLKMYPNIDHKFLFVNVGYNLRLTEIGGAMGSIQLPKLKEFVNSRRRSAHFLLKELKKYSSVLDFQIETSKGRHSWFGFPMVINKNAQFSVNELREHLEKNGVETRPIIAGNMALQPAVKMYAHRVHGSLNNCSHVMNNGLAVASHQSLDDKALKHIVSTIDSFMQSKGI